MRSLRFSFFKHQTQSMALLVSLLIMAFLSVGCSPNQQVEEVKKAAEQAVSQVKELSQNEIAKRLTEEMQSRIDKMKEINNRLITPNGNINWEEAMGTELAEYTFFSLLDFEYKARMTADGMVEVVQIDNRTGQSKRIAGYQVIFENGQVRLENK